MANKLITAGAIATVKAGRRLTRNHFKRKLITAGIAIFASLAISTTGFAAWLISTGDEKSLDGNVTVGAVQDASVTIENLQFKDDIDFLSFNGRGDDIGKTVIVNGVTLPNRVTTSLVEGENAESLSVELSCTIKNLKAASTLEIRYHEPQGVTEAVKAGYLTLPTNLNSTVPSTTSDGVTIYTLKFAKGDNGEFVLASGVTLPAGVTFNQTTGELTCTIAYSWGEKFGGKNPGNYYDEDDTGRTVPASQAVEQLKIFKAMCHNQIVSIDTDTGAPTFTELFNNWYTAYSDDDTSNDTTYVLPELAFAVWIDAET